MFLCGDVGNTGAKSIPNFGQVLGESFFLKYMLEKPSLEE